MKNLCIFSFLVVSLFNCQLADKESDWVSIFDGQTLEGWTASENTDTWSIKDGSVVCEGERSHLYYTGNVNNGIFKNFEFT